MTGTPALFLGVIEADGLEVDVVRVLKGAQPYTAFKEAIDSLLTSAR
jgi:hypothetical protein